MDHIRLTTKIYRAVLLLSILSVTTCTDLQETHNGNLTAYQTANMSNVDALFSNLVNSMKEPFQNPFSGIIPLTEITTDELIAPTRGPDWDDNGIWRSLHQHRWDDTHPLLQSTFNSLNGIVFTATNLLQFSITPEQEYEARFYRALAMYWLLDLFDQVPYRDPGESTLGPARVRRGIDALYYITSEMEVLIEHLPHGPPSKPNTNAARVLLMKCLINKGVYANRETPAFTSEEMNEVIKLADEIVASGQYSLSENYFDNFAPNNGVTGRENIFTQENIGGVHGYSTLGLYSAFFLHYKSTPFGFNGWTTLSDFYDKFEEIDKRRGQAYKSPGGPPNPGDRINLGFLVGQQYNLYTDAPLTDDANNPVVFTKEVTIMETGKDLQVKGIRPQKYALDYNNFGFPPPLDNDWVYFRLTDVLLMKAEAMMRGGTLTNEPIYGNSPLQIVNTIRSHPSRGASLLTTIDLPELLDERGREFWLECWRRQDLIRFGKFLDRFQEKDYISDPRCLVFAIPNQQIGLNRNLQQNPGY